ncbi:hypothetical protein TNCV_2646811 [Trichonephila clavipes]|nr:hypothetical protein TNCV_2646811 [Trichonephila clavipes]
MHKGNMALYNIDEICGCSSLVVKIMDSWPAYHECKPRTSEDPSCTGAMHVKSVVAQTSSYLCGEEVRRERYQLRCPRH